MNKKDLEQRDLSGQTPLHVAAKLGFLRAIEFVCITATFLFFIFKAIKRKHSLSFPRNVSVYYNMKHQQHRMRYQCLEKIRLSLLQVKDRL